MHISDPYIDSSGFLNRLPAILKFIPALAIIVITVALPRGNWPGYIIIAGLLIFILTVARIPIVRITKRLLLFEPFVVAATLLSLFQPRGSIIFLSLLLKGTISLLTMVMLIATTKFLDLIYVLKRLRLPGILITNISLMYRYLFLLLFEAERMSRARACREFRPAKLRIWHSNATVIGHLFVRTSKRANRIYLAMCARGWKV